MKHIILKTLSVVVAVSILLIIGNSACAQEILLDKMEKYGDLICYPGLDEPDKFYYLPDQPRLAYKDGRPQFSFLKYARTHDTGKAGIGRAEGGGIVHFLVTYGASEERVKKAEGALQKRHKDARIAGPIVYRKGNFALITSFKEGDEVITRTVAVGKAPLMEGQKTAVSMALTREGAELLWESFQSDTPDISLIFDMEFAGIREPYEATLEADWSNISKHDRVKAGVKYKWFGADVDMLFQELRQTGAIKITTKGENAVMDKILESANEKLLKVMFDPVQSDSKKTSSQSTATGALDQVLKLLKDATTSTSSSSSGTTTSSSNDITRDRNNLIQDPPKTGLWAFLFNRFSRPAYADSSGIETSSVVGEVSATESASESYSRARRLYEEARAGGFQAEATRAALDAYEKYQSDHNPTGSRAEEVEGRIRMLTERINASEAVGGAGESGDSVPDSDKKIIEDINKMLLDKSEKPTSGDTPSNNTEKKAGESTTDSGKTSTGTDSKSTAADTGTSASTQSQTGTDTTAASAKPKTKAQKSRAKGSPGFSLVASYQMKRIKRSGKMVYNMNNFRTETQAFAMAENIGDIYKHYGSDARIFRAVTIDDPVFKQREIMVTLDGQDASTFTKYLNFVTVKMKKRHQAGDVTTGEIVITPEIFDVSGNSFSMTYGWKNDSDRTAWLNYEYQAIWSFHGGVEIRTPWTETDSPMLALSPPHHYRTISIEGDGNTLTDAEVRHGVVTFSCHIGDRYIPRQITIRNDGTSPSMMLDIPEASDSPETQVDITWYLTKGRKLSSAVTILEGDILYWDELPKGGT